MAALVLIILLVASVSSTEILFENSNVKIFNGEQGFGWSVQNKNDRMGLQGIISVNRKLTSQPCTSDSLLCLEDDHTKVELTRADSCLVISTESEDLTAELQDCIDLGNGHWYGGPEQRTQHWPIQNATYKDYSYVTKKVDWMAVVERYWLNSNGIYMYVQADVPLFIDQNNYQENALCFIAKNKAPYLESRESLSLTYSICGLDASNPKEAHYDAIERFLHKPTGVPDERMFRHPVWSTWARYKGNISQDKVLEFADEIIANGFNNSQLEIDDNWETCYGSLTFDTSTEKFPDMRNLSLTLKELGFRVTLWIHPFINNNCEPSHSFASSQNYLVKNTEGMENTIWWRGIGGIIDFTNPDAVSWWVGQLNLLRENELIDSFKFDAGETGYVPQVPLFAAPLELQPDIYTVKYAETCAQFGSLIEVRVGSTTQHLPIFVRMLDKDSNWGYNNGLKALVTTLLQFNMVGYPFVLPDMIGGNGYLMRPAKQLFIRWLQANTFMPTMQFSYTPWDYDEETASISRKFTSLHEQYTDLIMIQARQSVIDGTPINPPIWWIAPDDAVALAIDNEFLVGEALLAAPILEEDAISRDIYLPAGVWIDGNDHTQYIGPLWLRDYPAPLDTLPYFIKS